MAPVDSPPSSYPTPLNPISPVPHQPKSLALSSPAFSRPATPWPFDPHSQSVSSPSNSTSPVSVSPSVSVAHCRHSQLRRSFSSPSVASPLLFALPSPPPASQTLLHVSHHSIGLHDPLPPSSPSAASLSPTVAPSVSFMAASRPASLDSVVSSHMSLPCSDEPQGAVSSGIPNAPLLNPCAGGPSSCSAVPSLGLGSRIGPMLKMECPSGSPAALPGLVDHSGLLSVQCPSSSAIGSTFIDDTCPTIARDSYSLGVSWASVVEKRAIGGKCPLKFYPPHSSDSENIRLSPPNVIHQGSELWGTTLVGYFVDDPVHFNVVSFITKKIWKRFELQHVAGNDSGFFFFRFSSSPTLEKCLANGPWMIAGHPFFLKKWWPGMILSREDHKSFPTWITLSGIPVEYWTPLGLSWIASAVGKPLFLDPATEKLERLGYARVCVELGINAPRPNSVKIRTKGRPGELNEHLCDIKIEYLHSATRRGGPVSRRTSNHPIKPSWVPKKGAPSRDISTSSVPSRSPPRLKSPVVAASTSMVIVPKAITTSNSFMALQVDSTNELSECPVPSPPALPLGGDQASTPSLEGLDSEKAHALALADPALQIDHLLPCSPPPLVQVVQTVIWSPPVRPL